MSGRPTISAEYLALQKELHEYPNYGVASLNFALPKLCHHWEISHLERSHNGFWVITEARQS